MSEIEQTLARWTDALKEHNWTARASDVAQLRSMEITLAEKELQRQTAAEFKKTIDSINEKVDAYRRLTAAIGAGYEAQKQAYILDTVQKASLGKGYSPAQKASIGSAAGEEYDAQQGQKTAADLDRLDDKVDAESRLAAATLRSSEAVREANLALQIEQITRDNDTASAQKLIAATLTLAAAEEKIKINSAIERLEAETAAQQRLNAARLQGADAVRAAQLQNQIDAIERTTAPGAEQDKLIADTKAQAQQAELERITAMATATDLGNKSKLEDLDKTVAKMKEIGATNTPSKK